MRVVTWPGCDDACTPSSNSIQVFDLFLSLTWILHAASAGHSGGHPQARQHDSHQDEPDAKEGDHEHELGNRIVCHERPPYFLVHGKGRGAAKNRRTRSTMLGGCRAEGTSGGPEVGRTNRTARAASSQRVLATGCAMCCRGEALGVREIRSATRADRRRGRETQDWPGRPCS